MHCAGVRGAGCSSTSSRKAAIVLTPIRRPTVPSAAIPLRMNATPGRSRTPASVVSDVNRRSSGRISGPRSDHWDGWLCSSMEISRTGVRHDSDRGVTFGRDDPEAPDVGTQHIGRLMELNLGAMDESAGDADLDPNPSTFPFPPNPGIRKWRG